MENVLSWCVLGCLDVDLKALEARVREAIHHLSAAPVTPEGRMKKAMLRLDLMKLPAGVRASICPLEGLDFCCLKSPGKQSPDYLPPTTEVCCLPSS